MGSKWLQGANHLACEKLPERRRWGWVGDAFELPEEDESNGGSIRMGVGLPKEN
ncbi:UNVERIFIED_CONTAM: hypothetical protein Sradi_1758900 [Sesamum radiatum]|uniref:Uncharacterized protein n=1 Tax=Sesamum radiatum TaxID=300843 RepID=A0AAW2TTN3_SESRA